MSARGIFWGFWISVGIWLAIAFLLWLLFACVGASSEEDVILEGEGPVVVLPSNLLMEPCEIACQCKILCQDVLKADTIPKTCKACVEIRNLPNKARYCWCAELEDPNG